MQLICCDSYTGLFVGRVSMPTQARLPQQLRLPLSQRERQLSGQLGPSRDESISFSEVAWSSMSCGYLLVRLWENAWA
jgi:hypothetical protein